MGFKKKKKSKSVQIVMLTNGPAFPALETAISGFKKKKKKRQSCPVLPLCCWWVTS